MSFQQKFLVEFVAITTAAVLALITRAYGIQIGILLILIARYGCKGAAADSWSALGLILGCAVALAMVAYGIPPLWPTMEPDPAFSWATMSPSPGVYLNKQRPVQPLVSREIVVLALWSLLIWRLRKRYQLTTPPIV